MNQTAMNVCLPSVMFLFAVVPVATSVSADETEALKAEITKAVEKVQEAGETENLHLSYFMSGENDTSKY